MADLYIATKTQADYDALMSLAEVAGYTWSIGNKPTQPEYWDDKKEETIIQLDQECRRLFYSDIIHPDFKGCAIETIPNLAGIKGIWHVTEENHPDFVTVYPKANYMLLVENGSVIQSDDGSFDYSDSSKYKALAVEYKPKESEEVMSEKVKLPKFMCDLLEGRKVRYPATALTITDQIADQSSEASRWLANIGNQWKLIDALRYGYEPEPEQLYYVPLIKNNEDGYLNRDSTGGHMYLDDNTNYSSTKTQFTMPEILAIDPRYKAFAVPVEEVDE